MIKAQTRPPQHQDRQPGRQADMVPAPVEVRESYVGSGKLRGKSAIITGGDSGIGRSVAIHFAKEGADIAIIYLEEEEDAAKTAGEVEALGRRCLVLKGDVGDEAFCKDAVQRAFEQLGHLEILVNNAAEQHPQESIEQITAEQLERTFRTNIFAMFFMAKAAIPYLHEGATIINTTSVTNYKGADELLDYSATKGAITAFTRSLSLSLAKKNIRVNGVAPGPIWTPLIPSTFPAEEVAKFGQDTPMGRAGQPAEVAPAFVFLASEDASYMTGQVLHPNGGTIVNA